MTPPILLLQRVLPIALLCGAVATVPYLLLSPTGMPRLEELERERERIAEERSQLADHIRQLRVEVDRVKNDPRAVERAARNRLGLVRQTEVIFQFDD